jgi:hypothetical protein
MNRSRIGKGLMIVVLATLVLGAAGFIVMWLWNWLLPSIAGLHAISFGQAVGLLVLCRLLVGGLRGHGGHHWHGRRHMQERWEQMTPEEREKFRGKFGRHCRTSAPDQAAT